LGDFESSSGGRASQTTPPQLDPPTGGRGNPTTPSVDEPQSRKEVSALLGIQYSTFFAYITLFKRACAYYLHAFR
jgi:hypothetical protein